VNPFKREKDEERRSGIIGDNGMRLRKIGLGRLSVLGCFSGNGKGDNLQNFQKSP
jgi:hypothetical protein